MKNTLLPILTRLLLAAAAAAIESQRAAGKRHPDQFLDPWTGFTKIQSGKMPALAVLFHAAQHVQVTVEKHVRANLRTDCDFAENLPASIKLKDAVLVLLAR